MPLLPASIGIVLNAAQSHVLLVKRDDVPVWVLPGGGIDSGETPEEALVREFQEETGYRVKILRKCALYHPINRLASETHVFVCQIQSGEICLSPETKAIAFHSISNPPSGFFPPHALWLQEAFEHQGLIKRPLEEITYRNLAKHFILHPWQVLRFGWTRFMKNKFR